MALTDAQRNQRNQQIAAAQSAISRGAFDEAQNIINNLIGGDIGGAQASLRGALNDARTRAQSAGPSAGVAPSASGGLSWTPAGGGQFIGGTPSNVPGGTSQPGAPSMPMPTGGGGGDGGGGGGAGGGGDDFYRQMWEAEQRQKRQAASAFIQDLLNQYGLGSLAGRVDALIQEFGPIPEVIMNKLRETGEYQQRFKGLRGLQQRGITDVRNEAEYLELESSYRQVFREAGLRDYLGQAGTQPEFDAIAKIVGDFSLSVDEVRERVVDAQRVVAETPQEVRDSLQRFYNIDPATLTQYVLDPQRTATEIQRRANAAIVGGYATRAGLQFGAGVSERIGEFLGGERNLQGTQIEPQLTEIADIQRSTQRLAEIEQGDLTAETTALATLDLDREARERVRTLQSRERARFGGRAGLTGRSLSDVSGI